MGKAKYPKYKPSKTLWQEQIPSHWQETELRMLFADNKNKNIGLVERNLLSLSYGKLKRKDIDNATGLVPASFEGYQIIDKGYIVLRFTDLQNDKKSLRVGYANEKGIITNAYIGLAPKTDIHSKYFYYQLHFLDKIKYFYNLGDGVRQSLAFKEFGREIILVPEKNEQIKIVSFLDFKLSKIERFISKKKSLIKLLIEQKASIINKAVTLGIDNKSEKTSTSLPWLNEVPKHWEIKPLKYFVTYNDETLPEKTDKEFELRYIDISNVDKDGKVAEIVTYKFKDAPSRAKRIVHEGDVIVSTVRTYLKAITQIKGDTNNLIVSTGFIVLRPKNKILSDYLNYAVRANYFIETVCSNSYGVSYPAINASDLVQIKIAIPDTNEQRQIVEFLDNELKNINEAISKIEKEIALTEEYKTTIIAEAVTGKIDVRQYELSTIEEETFEELEEELNLAAEEEAEYKKQEME